MPPQKPEDLLCSHGEPQTVDHVRLPSLVELKFRELPLLELRFRHGGIARGQGLCVGPR